MDKNRAREILNFDTSIDKKEMQKVFNDLQDYRFDENEKESKETLKGYFDKLSKMTLTIDEQVMLISRLYHQREFAGYLIGWQLSLREQKILSDVKAWNERKSQVPPEFLHMNEFFQRYEDRLPFKKSAMYEFKKIYETETLESFLKFGFSKTVYLMRIKDEDVAKKVRKLIDEKPDLTLKEIKEREIDYSHKIGEKRKEVKHEEHEEIRKKFTYDVAQKGEKIVLTPTKNVSTDNLYKALRYFEPAIKNYLAKCKVKVD